MLLRLAACCVLLGCAAAAVSSIQLAVLSSQPVATGALIRIAYNVSLSVGDDPRLLLLTPYVDLLQYGAEVGLLASPSAAEGAGEATLALPWSPASATSLTLQLAAQAAASGGPTMGAAPPAGAVLSNAVVLAVAPRAPVRAHTPAAGEALMTAYVETWFTPLNIGNWAGGPGVAEAIPMIGRYSSTDVGAIRAHAAQLIQAGVDAVVIDWTNNAWGIPTWSARQPDIQELVNATNLYLGVWAGLRHDEGWPVPRFIHLLGLDNGPKAPLPALIGELDYMVSAYLANASLAGSFVELDGQPLVLIFDGSGADHAAFTHANFSIRWMASQLQSTPAFAARGYWSWMDASATPILSMRAGAAEAAVLAPAYFAGGGWLNSGVAVGRSGGLTLLAEFARLLDETVGGGAAAPRTGRPPSSSLLPSFLNVCQFNEFAGAASGAAYEDSYSADLSNDLEPTSPFACGFRRPGNVRCGGGWGFRGVNALAAMRAALAAPAALDGSAAVFIVDPALGAVANYSTPGRVLLRWVTARFSAAGLASGVGYLRNTSLPVAIAIDGVPVAALPAPAAPGLTSVQLDVSALDARFPHVVTITAQQPATGDPTAHLTRWPLAADSLDVDAGAPLAQPVPAEGSAWLWLPESQ